jgi:hypothetical protein
MTPFNFFYKLIYFFKLIFSIFYSFWDAYSLFHELCVRSTNHKQREKCFIFYIFSFLYVFCNLNKLETNIKLSFPR